MIQLVICALVYAVGVTVGTAVIHEGAHMISAAAIGVPLNEIKLGFIGIYPSVSIPEGFVSTSLAVYYYSGGLTTGAILLPVYLFFWLRKHHSNPSLFKWIMGLITIIFIAYQSVQGYIEGRFHIAYMYDAHEGSFFNPVTWILNACYMLFLILAFGIHWKLCPFKCEWLLALLRKRDAT